jgi:hypothetical protein
MGLLRSIQCSAHGINEEFIPSVFAKLGADMMEGGSAKKQRDALYLATLSALDIKDTRANPPSPSEGLGRRLRLVKAGLQTVDQVRVPFAFDFPCCVVLIAIEIFGSTHG